MSGERGKAGGLKEDKHGQDSGEPTERWGGGEEQGEPGVEDGGFSHRVHCIYQEFLAVVQGNLEGIAPMLQSIDRKDLPLPSYMLVPKPSVN